MYYSPLLLPLFAQVALTFIIWHWMYFQRINEMTSKRITPQKLATRSKGSVLLDRSAASSDNLANQFEMPVLFYLAIVIGLMLLIRDPVLTGFAWLYVVLRFAHAVIHVTYNRVLHRFWAYVASCAALMVMWARLAFLTL